MLDDRGHVHHAGDVGTASAHEDPHPRLEAGDGLLRRPAPLGDQRAARLAQELRAAGRRAGGAGHRLGDVPRPLGGAGDEDPRPGGRAGIERAGDREAAWLQLDPDGPGELPRRLGGRQAGGEHQEVEAVGLQPPRRVHPADLQVARLGDLVHARDHGALVANPPADPGPVVEALEALAVGADVHEEDPGLRLGLVLAGDDGLLGGRHAAHRRAPVAPAAPVAAADALDPRHPPGHLAVRGTLDPTAGGPRGAEEPLVLEAGHDVGVPAVAELTERAGVDLLEAGRQHDRAHLHHLVLGPLQVVHRTGLAGLDAAVALRAGAAGETPLGLVAHLLLGEAPGDLLEAFTPLLRIDARLLRPRHRGRALGSPLRLRRQPSPPPLEPTAVEEGPDRGRGALAVGHGLDRAPGSADGVAAREHAGNRGLERVGIGGDPAAAQLEPRVAEARLAQGLADGDHHRVGRHGGPIGLLVARGEATLLVEDPRAAPELDALHPLGAQEAPRPPAGAELDPLLEGLGDLVGMGRHAIALLEADHLHRLGPQPAGRAGRVQGDVPAPDHRHPSPHPGPVVREARPAQEVQPALHAGELLTLHLEPPAGVGAGGEEGGVEALPLEQVLELEVRSDPDAAAELHAQVQDPLDLRLQHVAREPVLGHAAGQHAPRHVEGLEEGHRDALQRQGAGRRETRGTGAHHRDPAILAPRFGLGQLRGAVPALEVRQEALDGADGDGLVHVLAGAGLLAGPLTDAAAHRRQREVPADEREGLLVPPLPGEGHVALHAHVGRTGVSAGRRAALVDGVGVGDGLGVGLVDGLAPPAAQVEGVVLGDGAHLLALAAGLARLDVHVAGLAAQGGAEAGGVALQARQGCAREEADVGVHAQGDEPGREGAHGAVAGREGLVELHHASAHGALPLGQDDAEARVGEVDRRLHAGDSAPHHQDRAHGLFAHESPRDRRSGRGSTR